MSLTVGSRQNVSFATVHIVGNSNEDRACSLLSHASATRLYAQKEVHEMEKDGDMMSFGVFDGHNGAEAAQIAAENLHIGAVRSYMELLRIADATVNRESDGKRVRFASKSAHLPEPKEKERNEGRETEELEELDSWLETITREERKDSLFCLALNETVDCVSHIAQSESGAGCTVSSLFLRHVWPRGERDAEDQSSVPIATRALCANVGDSRCVLVTALRKRTASSNAEDGSSSSNTPDVVKPNAVEVADVPEEATGNEMTVGDAVNELGKISASVGSDNSDEVYNRVGNDFDELLSCGRNVTARIALFKMSEDHSVNCRREVRRISGRIPLSPLSLPIPVTWQPAIDAGAAAAEAAVAASSAAPSRIQRHTKKLLDSGISSEPLAESSHSDSSLEQSQRHHAPRAAVAQVGAGDTWDERFLSGSRSERLRCRRALEKKLRTPDLLASVISALCASPPLKPHIATASSGEIATVVDSAALSAQSAAVVAEGLVISAAVAERLNNPKQKVEEEAPGSGLDAVNKRNRECSDFSTLSEELLTTPQDLLQEAAHRVAVTLQSSDAQHFSCQSSFLAQSVHHLKSSSNSNLNSNVSPGSDVAASNPSLVGPQLIFDSTSPLLHRRVPASSAPNDQLQSKQYTRQQQLYLLRLYAARELQRRLLQLRCEYRSNRLAQLPLTESASKELDSMLGSGVVAAAATATANFEDQLTNNRVAVSHGADTERSKTYRIQLVHENSFIGSRYSSDGNVRGPKAYFGRFNHSLLMARSLGDRLGPRGCISMPDISAVTIPAGQHARFVLATDGLWDVITSETVRQWALFYQHRTAQDLAVYLAFKARRRRARLQMRQDDITITVVDVNPHCALFTNSNRTRPDALYSVLGAPAMRGRRGDAPVDLSSEHSSFENSAMFAASKVKPSASYRHLISANPPGKVPLAIRTSAEPSNSSIDFTFKAGMACGGETIAHYTLRQPNAAICSVS